MEHESKNEIDFLVEESHENFSSWVQREYIPDELKIELSKANVLLVPREGFREYALPVFPVGTEELFNFLKENTNKGLVTDICIANDDYKELALHEALLIIGSFIVTSIVGPIIADLISEYIKKRWVTKEDKLKIKVELTVVEKDGRASRLLYEGPAKDFTKTVKPTLTSLANKDQRIKEKN